MNQLLVCMYVGVLMPGRSWVDVAMMFIVMPVLMLIVHGHPIVGVRGHELLRLSTGARAA